MAIEVDRRFTQVDVFGPESDGFGNPLAVVVDGAGLTDAELADAATVRGVTFDHSLLGPFDHLGVVGRDSGRFAYEVRGQVGAWEDPVTGSLNASVAQWLRARGAVPPDDVATQGSQLGRRGEIFVHDGGTEIWIGGRVRPVITGTVDL